jgi:surfeit locus 1 family protein
VKRSLLLLLSLACIAGFVRLGFWQLHRADFKEASLAHSRQIVVARKDEPLAAVVDADAPVSDGYVYTWVAGSGHFLPMPAVLLDNQSRGERAGVRVYRVFQPDGGRRAVLVELGWRELPPNRKLPTEPPLPGAWRFDGLLAPPPAAGISLGENPIQRQPDGVLLLMRLNTAEVAKALALSNGLAPRVLRLNPQNKLGYARDLDVMAGALPPEQHRGYAVQWFAMAIGLLVATIAVARSKPRQKNT